MLRCILQLKLCQYVTCVVFAVIKMSQGVYRDGAASLSTKANGDDTNVRITVAHCCDMLLAVASCNICSIRFYMLFHVINDVELLLRNGNRNVTSWTADHMSRACSILFLN